MGSIFHANAPYTLAAGASILLRGTAGDAGPSVDYLVTENAEQATENSENVTENGP